MTVIALRSPVDKSYRRMIAGMELFEKRHNLAPAASLRFKLLPRNRATNMQSVELQIAGDSFSSLSSSRPTTRCDRTDPWYLFFADRPIFSVALVSGARREVLPVDMLYGGASRGPDWKSDLPYCDCEVLLDRTYFMPLGDPSWPDDTLVEFEYMDGGS